MASLLHQLLFDVKQRCAYLWAELERLKDTLPTEAKPYRDRMAQLLARSSQRIEALINDPGVQHPHLARNYYYDYKRLAELVQAVEEGPVLALVHYGDKDQLATKIVHRICAEIRYPYAPPLCSAISAQYYWSLTGMDLIFVPCSEPFHLLGLADLYHELAHFILFRDEKTLLRPYRPPLTRSSPRWSERHSKRTGRAPQWQRSRRTATTGNEPGFLNSPQT